MKRRHWLDDLLASLPPALEEEASEGDTEFQHFDPDRDNLGAVFRDVATWASNDLQYFGQWADALEWLDEPVGLDFSDLQARWRDVPDIIVTKHVSDEPRGLFGYLDQIRLAYVVGADLAAIALCRSTTELLIRYHYASHVPNAHISSGKGRRPLTGTNPLGLIAEAENRYDFLKNFNLGKKVDDANKILHQPITGEVDEGVYSIEGRHRNPHRGLMIEWWKVLEEMVPRAPEPGADTTES